MSNQDNRRPSKIWTAAEIEAQLDEISVVVSRGAREFLAGLFFGAPARPKPKPQKPDRRQS